jgi:hypothetical protein
MDYKPKTQIIVPRKDDLVAANKISKTLESHRLRLSYFGHEGVGFYRKQITDTVPVYHRFHFDRKEFRLLLEKLNEIDELKLKIEDLQHRFMTYTSYIDKHR